MGSADGGGTAVVDGGGGGRLERPARRRLLRTEEGAAGEKRRRRESGVGLRRRSRGLPRRHRKGIEGGAEGARPPPKLRQAAR